MAKKILFFILKFPKTAYKKIYSAPPLIAAAFFAASAVFVELQKKEIAENFAIGGYYFFTVFVISKIILYIADKKEAK